MKRIQILLALAAFGAVAFAETNANDTQQSIVNSLLIQQMLQNQQQGQQQAEQSTKKKRIENEDDLLEAGYRRFKLDSEAEDYIVFKSKRGECEVDIWAEDKRGDLQYCGSVVVQTKKGYKGQPLNGSLNSNRAVWLKVIGEETAIIKNLGEKHSDQYFEIQ